MVFVTAVRDYIDFLNDSFTALGQSMSTQQIVQQTALYFVESCRIAFLYIVTLQWLRDFLYLPILIPHYTSLLYKEALVLAGDPSFNLFSFGATPTIVQNKFFVGFFNSIFACLPFSCAHLVALRRFYLQGWPVAWATSLGIILGHVFFLTSVLFGWRTLLFPWLHFEPWNYIVGLYLIARIVYNFGRPAGVAQYRRFAPKDLSVYLSMGAAACVLTLCEQGVIFQHLTTFTVGLEPSFMEPLTGTSQNLVLAHSMYLFGFLLGSFLFTFLSYGAALGFRFIVTQICLITDVRFHMYYQHYSRYVIMGIAVATVPFYGLDYFVINPLGFVPNDTALTRGSLFAPNTLVDTWFKEHNGEYDGQGLATYPYREDYPLAGFDRGIYFSFKEGVLNPDSGDTQEFLTDEDYMLPVENAWRTRLKRGKTRRRDLMRNHKASLQRVKIWLRKVAPALADAEKKTLEQQQRTGSDRLAAMALATPVERAKGWTPEQFNQFTILDNYTFSKDPYRLQPPKAIFLDAFDASHHLVDTRENFKKEDFEGIGNLEDLTVLVNTMQRGRKESGQQGGKNLRLASRRKLAEAPRYSLVQNFEEKVHSKLSHYILDRVDPRNFYFLRLWETMNTFLPEEVQHERLASSRFKVPFQKRKHKLFNRNFRNNVYYKPLMRTDIDAFLSRQPKHHLLTPAEEAELYFKRTMLSDYYNSMRRYKNMNRGRRFLLAYGGTKSLAHKVYNHQFKGTYRVARRLFAVDLRAGNPASLPKRVLKYDQPLYDETKNHNPMLHEELQKRRQRVKRTVSEKVKGSQRARRTLRANKLPFFRAANNRPFYCGWNARTRQFVLTNLYDQRRKAGSVKKVQGDKNGPRVKIRFTSWPIKNPHFKITDRDGFIRNADGSMTVNVAGRGWTDTHRRGVFPTNRRNRLVEHTEELKYLAKLFDPRVPPSKQHYGYSSSPDPGGLRPWENFPEWPAGFQVRPWMQANGWWQNEHPPTPFADRGGFVWPGQEKLKVQYLPKDMQEAFDNQAHDLLGGAVKMLRNNAEAFYGKLFT
jgi:hypothetical protein